MHRCTKPILTKQNKKNSERVALCEPSCKGTRTPAPEMHCIWLCQTTEVYTSVLDRWSRLTANINVITASWARANEQVNALILKTYNAIIWASQMEATPSKHCTQRCRESCFIKPFQHKRCFERHQQTLQMSCIIGSINIGAHGTAPLSAG